MKPKKSPHADLRKRRVLFFEAGLAFALAAVSLTFSAGFAEQTTMNIRDSPIPVVRDLPPVTRQEPEKRVEARAPQYFTELIKIVPNSRITTDYQFPDPETFTIEIPSVEAETPIDDIPVWFAEEMPSFRGGDLGDFRRWVLSYLVYPSAAIDNNMQGRVVVQFVIEKDGTLSNIEVVSSPDSMLAGEAVRVLEMSPVWTPGRQRGRAVRVGYTLPVDFRLAK